MTFPDRVDKFSEFDRTQRPKKVRYNPHLDGSIIRDGQQVTESPKTARNRANRNDIPSHVNDDSGKNGIEQLKQQRNRIRSSDFEKEKPKPSNNRAMDKDVKPLDIKDNSGNKAIEKRKPPSNRVMNNVANPKENNNFNKPSDFDVGRKRPLNTKRSKAAYEKAQIIENMKRERSRLVKTFTRDPPPKPPINRAIDDAVKRLDVRDEKGKRVIKWSRQTRERAKDNSVKDDSVSQIMRNLRVIEKRTNDKRAQRKKPRDVPAEKWWKRTMRSM